MYAGGDFYPRVVTCRDRDRFCVFIMDLRGTMTVLVSPISEDTTCLGREGECVCVCVCVLSYMCDTVCALACECVSLCKAHM